MSDPLANHLDSLGVPNEIIACDPALADTAQFCKAYDYSLDDSANTIVVAGKAEHAEPHGAVDRGLDEGALLGATSDRKRSEVTNTHCTNLTDEFDSHAADGGGGRKTDSNPGSP